MSNEPSPTTFNVNIRSNPGTASFGHGNTINVNAPGWAALGLTREQMERLDTALKSLREGADPREDNDDAKALKAAAAEPDVRTRGEKIRQWLLKVAPHAAGLAGTIVNPVVGEVAKAATAWAARALGNKD
jgi:hypothetical protein